MERPDQSPPVPPEIYVDNLRRITRLSRGIVRDAIARLGPRPGSTGIDLGCGIGVDTLLLAAAVGDGGRVIGLDPSPEMLAAARAIAEESGLAPSVELLEGSIERLPIDDGSADWIWCKDAFWPMPGMAEDPVVALAALRRVLRTGGKVALLFWTSQTLLSGYPQLEALLGTYRTESLPYLGGISPHRHFLRAAGWMRRAGFGDVRAESIGACHLGPLAGELQDAVGCVFQMFFGGLDGKLSDEDRTLLGRITDPASPDYLPRRADYCCSLSYSLFIGVRDG